MPLMSGKRAFLELLRQEGVEVIFGNPGTTELPLMDALAVETSPRYVLGLQEGAVMAMAGGYAQAAGRLAAVNIHVAPGLGNAMGMLYDAQKAGAPLIVTAGQHDQSFALTEPIRRRSHGPSSNGRPRCAASPICRASSTAPPRRRWPRRQARSSSPSRRIS
jgi:benzoylformate decarboxylase